MRLSKNLNYEFNSISISFDANIWVRTHPHKEIIVKMNETGCSMYETHENKDKNKAAYLSTNRFC